MYVNRSIANVDDHYIVEIQKHSVIIKPATHSLHAALQYILLSLRVTCSETTLNPYFVFFLNISFLPSLI